MTISKRLTKRFNMPLRDVVNHSIRLVEQVLSDSGKVDKGLNPKTLQQTPVADPGELQKLRCLERA